MTPRERQELGREHALRAAAERAQRLREVKAAMPFMRGDPQVVTGRIGIPGELPGIAAIGSQDNTLGLDESIELTRRPFDIFR